MENKILSIIAKAKELAIEYYNLTGKPLGITGEVAELEVAKILNIELEPARQSGYDAIWNGHKLQIKGRRKFKGKVPKINLDGDWDFVALLLLDEKYNTDSLYICSKSRIKERLQKTKSKNEKEGKFNISTFKSISEFVWLQGDHSIRTINKDGLINLAETNDSKLIKDINAEFLKNLFSKNSDKEFTPEYHGSTIVGGDIHLHLYKNGNEIKRKDIEVDLTKSYNEIENLKAILNRKNEQNSIRNKLSKNEILLVPFSDPNIIGCIVTTHPIKSIPKILKGKKVPLEQLIFNL